MNKQNLERALADALARAERAEAEVSRLQMELAAARPVIIVPAVAPPLPPPVISTPWPGSIFTCGGGTAAPQVKMGQSYNLASA